MKLILTILLSILSLNCLSQGSWSQLRSPAFEGGNLTKLIYTPEGIFVTGSSGIFKSIDDGMTWESFGDGLFELESMRPIDAIYHNGNIIASTTSKKIIISPITNPDWKVAYTNDQWRFKDGLSGRLFVLGENLYISCFYDESNHTRILQSKDGGLKWLSVFEAKDQNLISFTNGENIFLANSTSLFTLDGTQVNKVSLKGLPASIQLENPLVFGNSFIFTNKVTKQLFRVSSLSYTFQHIKRSNTKGFTEIPNNYEVSHSAQAQGIIFAGFLNKSNKSLDLYSSLDTGVSWQRMRANGISSPELAYFNFVGTSDQSILGLFSHELNFRDLLEPNYFYFQSRVLRSYDYGENWETSMSGLFASNLRIAGRENGFVAFHNTTGLHISTDQAKTWNNKNNRGLPSKPYQVKLYEQNEGSLALLEDKEGDSRALTDINTRGNIIRKNIPSVKENQSIQLLGSHLNKFYFIVKYEKDEQKEYFMSKDAGSSWDTITLKMEACFTGIRGMVSNDSLIIAYGKGSDYNMGTFQSKDNGETWKNISSGIEEKNYVVKKVVFARNIAFATIKANNKCYLYKRDVYKGHWEKMDAVGLTEKNANFNIYEYNGAIYLCGDEAPFGKDNPGILISLNLGKEWRPFNTGLPSGSQVNTLSFGKGFIIAGTANFGAFIYK